MAGGRVAEEGRRAEVLTESGDFFYQSQNVPMERSAVHHW